MTEVQLCLIWFLVGLYAGVYLGERRPGNGGVK